MVRAVRKNRSIRSVAAQFGVSPATVQRWVAHAGNRRLDRVDFSGRRGGRRDAQATSKRIEDLVLALRTELRETSDLGEHGAEAIRRELFARREALQITRVPSIRTIGRILERRGALDGSRRVRWPAPAKGWYLPDVRAQQAEVDSFDFVVGLVIRGGIHVEVLNGISLLGGLCMSRAAGNWTAKKTVSTLIEHWREVGLPAYSQFDNDTIFQGNHRGIDSFGRVTRLCLSLGVTPVFAPPRETGFQAAIESYNGRWQRNVWRRFTHPSRTSLAERSDRYVAAARGRSAARIESAPPRRPFPNDWALDLSQPLTGTVVFIRRTDEDGHVKIVGRNTEVCRSWCHRLVRCELDLTHGRMRFYRLRRRDPTHQPLLRSLAYQVPTKRFHE